MVIRTTRTAKPQMQSRVFKNKMGQECVRVKRGELVWDVVWDKHTKITDIELLEAMLDDMGGREEQRQAVRAYCLGLLKEVGPEGIEEGDLNIYANTFLDGYNAALHRSSLSGQAAGRPQ